MADQTSKISVWASRLKRELKRDKKRTAVMAVLLVVGGSVGGRLVITRDVPKRVGAAESAEAAAASRQKPSSCQGAGAASPEQPGQAHREQYLAQMDRTITRKLFTPVLELYRPAEDGSAGAHDGQARSGWFGQAHEWIKRKRQVQANRLSQIAGVRTQARTLSLKSTMLAASPTALINDRVLRVGESISGFRVKRIGAGYCVLSKDGVEVQLRLKK